MSETAAKPLVDIEAVREIVAEHIGSHVNLSGVAPEADLYNIGLTSLATVGLMLALEARFDVEFPEALLSRGTFRSLAAIADAVSKLVG